MRTVVHRNSHDTNQYLWKLINKDTQERKNNPLMQIMWSRGLTGSIC